MASNLQAAIDVVNAGMAAEAAAAPAPAPTPEPSTESAPASTDAPAAPDAAAPAPTPAAAPVVADETAELIAKLDARKAERSAKQTPDATARLEAKIAELEARLAQTPPAPSHPDFAALVRQHGEVEALRLVGIEPLEHFERFKVIAKDKEAFARRQAQQAEADRIAKLEEAQAKLGKTWEEQQAARAQAEEQAMWANYMRMTEAPESGTPLLAKLPPSERYERTQRKIASLTEQFGAEAMQEISDAQLAKLVEKDIRSLRDLLAGTDPGATTTHVPATDGARTQPSASPASLTNADAAQTTGNSSRRMTDKERLAAAIKVVEEGLRSQ